ncbi:MAG: prepilin-type N-terminal cleavage/methylation domain-containing protein, partial [Proteobacteria bacterium]|nr:prepilin-type N-terminal cleavage/methylation domain-containing protein [Desulfobacteraceae bacterium]MBU4100900.1 prepilin-type N-terminal cleavage/methylation domain-containing protein [Pseudomonadota bacterium]
MTMTKIDNNNGFTLIEVLVAMVILSVGLLGTAALITGIIKGN